jgi:predicted site-specific integrase-resolvase
MAQDKLLGITDVARRLSCSVPTVSKLADRGQLAVSWTESGRRIFTERDVVRFIESRNDSATPAPRNVRPAGRRHAPA